MYASAPSRLATLAYDATALAAVFVKSDGRFDVSEITAPQGFAGRDGKRLMNHYFRANRYLCRNTTVSNANGYAHRETGCL